MNLDIYQIDAFTGELFGGNPAAVVPLREWLPDDLMQRIAMENNLSETAFFIPLPPDRMQATGADYHIRWFTPDTEVDLCGHATLAAAWVIDQVLELDTTTHRVTFLTEKAGLLPVRVEDKWYTLDMPTRMPEPCPVPEGMLQALGLRNDQLVRVLRGRDYLVVVDSEATVRSLRPDFAALKQQEGLGVIVSARGDAADAVSRCFYPKAGINEDPVTGSAHCHIVPYWSEQLGKRELVCRQLSARGGELVCVHKGDRVWMSGQGVMYLRGEILLADED